MFVNPICSFYLRLFLILDGIWTGLTTGYKGQWLKVETVFWDLSLIFYENRYWRFKMCFTHTYRGSYMWNQWTGSGNFCFMKLYWKSSTVKNRTKTTSFSVPPSMANLRLFGCLYAIFDWFYVFSVSLNLFSADLWFLSDPKALFIRYQTTSISFNFLTSLVDFIMLDVVPVMENENQTNRVYSKPILAVCSLRFWV